MKNEDDVDEIDVFFYVSTNIFWNTFVCSKDIQLVHYYILLFFQGFFLSNSS